MESHEKDPYLEDGERSPGKGKDLPRVTFITCLLLISNTVGFLTRKLEQSHPPSPECFTSFPTLRLLHSAFSKGNSKSLPLAPCPDPSLCASVSHSTSNKGRLLLVNVSAPHPSQELQRAHPCLSSSACSEPNAGLGTQSALQISAE